ncbi:MAG TPA: hypothetical protein DGH68_11665 [Bacteroidetes bacterium]|nr:hypothetical protein [Bacteroidota bacterium]
MRTDTALTAVQEIRASGKPGAYHLADSYPNPFNPTTTITFQIPTGSVVSLKVFDLLGREVATLVEGTMQPGSYTSRWNASGFGSGVYICKLTAGEYSEAKKLILMK